jgi:hypothetical protein
MPVKRREGKARRELTAGEESWLRDGLGAGDEDSDIDLDMKYFWCREDFEALWSEFADDIVAEHVAESPGTRPHRWWGFSAPEKLRKRLGGIGTPYFQEAPALLCKSLGVPEKWIFGDEVRFYDRGTPLDTEDPPVYESQAAYLERLKLFLPGERKRLKPKDFEPENVIDILEIEFEDDDEAADSV